MSGDWKRWNVTVLDGMLTADVSISVRRVVEGAKEEEERMLSDLRIGGEGGVVRKGLIVFEESLSACTGVLTSGLSEASQESTFFIEPAGKGFPLLFSPSINFSFNKLCLHDSSSATLASIQR